MIVKLVLWKNTIDKWLIVLYIFFVWSKEKMKPFKTKVADFWGNNGNVVKTSCLFAVWVSLAFASGYCFYKSDVRRKERLRQEMEKEIWQKIKAEQQKQDSIIRYNDAQRIR